jgi:c-di-GMP-related signal transduction protein
MPEFLARLIARIVFSVLRYWILHRSDKHLARSLRLVRRVAFALSGDQMVLSALTDLVEIFEAGGKDTELIRRMARETTPEYARAILRSLMRKD